MKSNRSLTALATLAMGASFLFAQTGMSQTPASPSPSPATTGTDGCTGCEHWHHHFHGGHGSPLEHLSKALNLTEDQKAKIQPIIQKSEPQLKAIWQDARAKTKAVMDSVDTQIRPLLTPEQQQKLDAMKAHFAQGRAECFEHRIDHRVAKLTKALNLTADQQGKVKATMEAARPQLKAIWQNSALSKDDKIAQSKTVHDDTRAKIRALLTPDQQKQFDALVAAHQAKHS